MGEKIYNSFNEFWPFYVREHGHRFNRFLHLVGTTGGIILVLSAIATRTWWLLAIAPVFGYGFAWVGHFFVEKNRPATFTYPRWSLMGDFKMMTYMLQGRMGPELVKAFDRQTLRQEQKKG